MLLSEIQAEIQDSNVVEIRNEKPFTRFSRTTSKHDETVCVWVGAKQFIPTIPKNATMVITTSEIADEIENPGFGICVSQSPKTSYFRFFSASCKSDEKKKTEIGDNCSISPNASICDHNVKIGNNVVIEDFATIYGNVTIEDNCIIRSGARIGVQDYNYYNDSGKLIHLQHYGSLIIKEDVEIGFNSVVGKSIYPEDCTIIGEGSKLANCCAVGHDCVLGKRVMIYAGSMVAGYVHIGDDTHITLNCTIRNDISIGKNVQVKMGSVVLRDIPDGATVFGNPAKRVITPNIG